MKHQYFGDVNDYVKYGLLRCFADAGFCIGVCWMLTENDGLSDGRKTMYLCQPEKWKPHDPHLFETLSKTLARPDGRHLDHIEANDHIPRARFFGEVVKDCEPNRSKWYKRALAKLNGSDLVFFDPDNGIEVASKPIGRKNSSKYIYWKEIKEAWNTGTSLLIFQHFPRRKRDEYIPTIVQELKKKTKGSVVVPLRSSNVLFLLAHRPRQRDRVDVALGMLDRRWYRRVWNHEAT